MNNNITFKLSIFFNNNLYNGFYIKNIISILCIRMDYWKTLKIKNNIKYVSIVVYAKTPTTNDIIILVGKEFNNKPNKTDLGLYSGFHGDFENDESIPQAASRILFESTMNMLDDQEKIYTELSDHSNIKFKIISNTIILLYEINYERFEHLPTYYNKVFTYMHLCRTSNSMNNWVMETCPFNYFNKIDLIWANYAFIKQNIKQFKKKFISNLFA